MNMQVFREKCGGLLKRIGRRGVIAACAVVILAGGAAANWALISARERGRAANLAVDLSALSVGEAAEADEAAAAPVYNYFEAMQLSRRQARDEAMEVLLSVAESTTAVEAMKTDAMDGIARIARDIEAEANIESLILSKGFSQCVAVVNGDAASVIVKSAGLLPSEIAQISEIVYEQAGILPVNLKIIERDV